MYNIRARDLLIQNLYRDERHAYAVAIADLICLVRQQRTRMYARPQRPHRILQGGHRSCHGREIHGAKDLA